MNIVYLTLVDINSLDERGIYPDLFRYLVNEGHFITIVAPKERRRRVETNLKVFNGYQILQVKTLNIQKTHFIEKGAGTVLIDYQYIKAIKKYIPDIKFDLIIYSTPPITFTHTVNYLKKRDGASTYLLLKDIFPQNAVDLNMMKKNSLIHLFFRNKEKNLYNISEFIGCMSPANVSYLLKHNNYIKPSKVEVCPNSIEPVTNHSKNKETIKSKYNIPPQSTICIYGGNLGKPQGIDFLIEILKSNKGKDDRFFIIVGSGTEYSKIQRWVEDNNPDNAILIEFLPKELYDTLVSSCDIGFIFLDKRFTIPNFPSRILTYMENKMPVLIASDINTDIGSIAEENGYGFWSEHGDIKKFNTLLDKLTQDEVLRINMGQNGYNYLLKKYTVDKAANIILNHYNV